MNKYRDYVINLDYKLGWKITLKYCDELHRRSYKDINGEYNAELKNNGIRKGKYYRVWNDTINCLNKGYSPEPIINQLKYVCLKYN